MTFDSPLTRRGLFALSGATAAAAWTIRGALPARADAAADVIVVGAGLAGLVATTELVAAGRRVLLLDQEPESGFGGQAHWSLGGLFLIDSAEQRLAGIKDSLDLARGDWFRTAGWDRGPDDVHGEDYWGKRWAEAYLQFAAGEKQSWLRSLGLNWVPVVGWAERGQADNGIGNSVPRFHVTLGTGPGVVEPFDRMVRAAAGGAVTLRFRHRVDELVVSDGAVIGVRGAVLEPSDAVRGTPSSRTVAGDFEFRAAQVIVTTGGIGGNHELVRRNWPARLGNPPARMITGVPEHVDGRMLGISAAAGARLVNRDRMWHYTEGIANHSPIWPGHGIRVLAAPSAMWFDAAGERFPQPGIPSVDTLGTLELIMRTGYDYSWFVLNKRIAEKEFVLSGSEQNPELTGKDLAGYLAMQALTDVPPPVQAFLDRGEDFVIADDLPRLVAGMNRLAGRDLIAVDRLRDQIMLRDTEIQNPASTDPGVLAVRRSRAYIGDSLVRTTEPHPILAPEAGPLIAIRMNIVTRKTLGGLQTDLSGRVLDARGEPIRGLYAAGEVAGFGGGGVHGYRALEGTFLGGCLFTGRETGRAAARDSA
ncbi:FAD-binding dehydrogenase [Nocardia sp. NPDC127579]|uniref:FAD-binding dehydrogenase n=1 Tax=Nocardia sp. NPDC127579 TaxID=3345402 RepID=UPI00362E837F